MISTKSYKDTIRLIAKLIPDNSNNQKVTWKSNDAKVAVTGMGLIATVVISSDFIGTAIVTATTEDGSYSDTYTIDRTVKATGMKLTSEDDRKNVDGCFKLTPVFTPSNASNKECVFLSSNNSYITIDDEGYATIVNPDFQDNVSITCISVDGGFRASAFVSSYKATVSEIVTDKGLLITTVCPSAYADENNPLEIECNVINYNPIYMSDVTKNYLVIN